MSQPNYSRVLQMFHKFFFFEELDSHGYTVVPDFIGMLLERLVYTAVSASLIHRLLIPKLHWKQASKSHSEQCY